MGGARAILGQFIPVFPPIILSFESPKTSHYSHNLVPIILKLFSTRAAKEGGWWPSLKHSTANLKVAGSNPTMCS